MSRPRYFATRDTHDPGRARLDAETARHLRSRRIDIGDTLYVILGPGEEYAATLAATHRDGAIVETGTRRVPDGADPEWTTTLLLALADPPRLDLVTEKATELGATELVFFRAERSQQPGLAAKRRSRLERLARLAAEQCGRTTIPAIAEAPSLESALASLAAGIRRLAFSPEAKATEPAAPLSGPRAVLVGPEGGFSATELRLIEAEGCETLSLGPRILRFETAALAALARWNGSSPSP